MTPGSAPQPVLEDRRPSVLRLVGFLVLLALVSWGLGAFAAFPWTASPPGAAMVRVGFKHVAAFEGARPPDLSPEELARLPRHMRPASAERARTGRRLDTVLRVRLDGEPVLERRYAPGGLRHDGPAFGYEELPVRPGRHLIEAELSDRAAGGGPEVRRWHVQEEVDLPPGRSLLVEFTEDEGFRIR